MDKEKYTLPKAGGIMIHTDAADALLKSRSGDAALVYICMLRMNSGMTPEEAAEVLGTKDSNRGRRALDTLRGLGLISCGSEPATEPKEELPRYSYGDIKRELENGAVFPTLVDEVQRALGRILSSEDLIKLFGIYDSLGLPPEVILQLVNYCIRLVRERYGEGRQVHMRFIEKEAYAWERAEIFTIDRAEEYIMYKESMRTSVGEFQRMLQIGGRRMSPSERAYVESWITMGFSPEAAELAYDRTVLKTGKLTWKYMDAILRGWHEKNLHTPEEIGSAGKKPSNSGPVTSANDDYERMKKMLREIKGES